MFGTWIVRLMTAAALTGSVTYYNPGVMERVYENRLAWGHVQPCEECVGMVALLDREHVGKQVYLVRDGGPVEGPFLVVDCSAAQDIARHRRNGKVAEVDWPTAQRWGMTGPLANVRVVFRE